MPLPLDLYKFAKNAPSKPVAALKTLTGRETSRYSITSLASYLFYYILGLVLVSFLNMPLLIGNGLAFLLSFSLTWFIHAFWTFKTDSPAQHTLPRYMAAHFFGLLLNAFVIETLCRKAKIPYPLAAPAAICIVPFFLYLVCKFWVFRKILKNEMNNVTKTPHGEPTRKLPAKFNHMP